MAVRPPPARVRATPEVLEMNLKAIRRTDPAATEILDSASHVVVYRFDTAANGWVRPLRRVPDDHAAVRSYCKDVLFGDGPHRQERNDVEGPFFLFRRCVPCMAARHHPGCRR